MSASENAAPPVVGHDAYRIRGDALRRSLFWALIAWVPGALWQAWTSGGSATKLAQHMGANDFWIGAMTAAPFIAVLLQIPGAMTVEWLGKRKWFFIWTVSAHRLLYVVIGLLPWLMPASYAPSAIIMIALITLALGLNNLGGAAWVNWMADLVPQRVRGKYFAKRSRWGIATMIFTSLLLGAAMDAAGTDWFKKITAGLTHWNGMPPLILLLSIVFIVGGLIGVLDILAFIGVDEPPMKRSTESIGEKLRKPLRDKQFMVYCTYWSIWTFANSFGGTLWWLNVFDFFKRLAASPDAQRYSWWLHNQYLMCFIALPVGYQIGQFLGFPIWGRAVDRFGRKPVMFVSSTLHTISWIFWIFLSPTMLPWMPIIQICGGIVGAGQDVGSFNMMLQFNRKGGSGYQALGSVLFAIAGAAAAFLCGGLLVALHNFSAVLWEGTPWQYHADKYTVLILIAVAIKYLGDLAVLPYVHDLAARPRRETVRYLFSNMYGTINTLVFAPVAAGIGATGRTLGQVKNKVADAAEVAGANFRKWFR